MAGEWTTADYALIVSLCSAAISLFSLGWNVWSKFIFPKPKVVVELGVCGLVNGFNGIIYIWRPATTLFDGHDLSLLKSPAMVLKATNFGPGPIKLNSAIFKTGGWLHTKRYGHAMIFAYKNYPFDLTTATISVGSPERKLETAESVELHFPINSEILKIGPKLAGFSDSFSRLHFCSYRDARHFKKIALKVLKY